VERKLDKQQREVERGGEGEGINASEMGKLESGPPPTDPKCS